MLSSDGSFWAKRVSQMHFQGDSLLIVGVADSNPILNSLSESFATCIRAEEIKTFSPNITHGSNRERFDALYLENFEADEIQIDSWLQEFVPLLKPNGRLWLKCAEVAWQNILTRRHQHLGKPYPVDFRSSALADSYFSSLHCWNVSFGPLGHVLGEWINVEIPSRVGGNIEVHCYRKPGVTARLVRSIRSLNTVARESLLFVRTSPDWYIKRHTPPIFNNFYAACPENQVITNFTNDLYPHILRQSIKTSASKNPKLLDQIVERLCSNTNSPREAMLCIFKFVQSAILRDPVTQPLNSNGSLPSAEELLLAGVGRCGHASHLLVSMLQKAGIRSKIWQLPRHVSVKASYSANEWVLLDADAYKFGVVPMATNDLIPIEAVYENPRILNRLPATGWFYDDLIRKNKESHTFPRGYTEAVSFDKRGFVSNFFDENDDPRRKIYPPAFVTDLQAHRLGTNSWRLTWSSKSLDSESFSHFQIKLSSKTRGWSYSTFRRLNTFPQHGIGDISKILTERPETIIELPSGLTHIFAEVTAIGHSAVPEDDVYFWPSDELELKTIS